MQTGMKQHFRWRSYLKRNWFKIGIVLLLLYVAFRKDLSFNVNLNAPTPSETPMPKGQIPGKKSREIFTEKLENSTVQEPNKTQKFNFSPLGSNSTNREPDIFKQDGEKVQKYIRRFANVAIKEREKFGIPASITIANALLHSNAGDRLMAQKGNNQFGLVCTEDWIGETGSYEKACYRHYPNAWTSFRDHSLYITTGPMAPLKTLDSRDYEAWAKALELENFSTQNNLAYYLLKIIEEFQLKQLDQQ